MLAAGVLIIFGVGERGTAIALRATARWSFLLLRLAYVGGSIAWLCGPRFDGLVRHGRGSALPTLRRKSFMLGSCFKLFTLRPDSAPWCSSGSDILYLSPRLFSGGGFVTYSGRVWWMSRTIALEYIAIAFAADFIVGPLHAEGLGKFRPLCLPFALMLVVGRDCASPDFLNEKLRRPRETLPLTIGGSPVAARIRSKPGEDRLIVWPVFVFLAGIMALLALDDAIWGLFELALALYGPALAILGVYFLLKSAVRGRGFIWNEFEWNVPFGSARFGGTAALPDGDKHRRALSEWRLKSRHTCTHADRWGFFEKPSIA